MIAKQKVPSYDRFLHCRKEAFPEPAGDNEEKLIISGKGTILCW